MHSIRGLLINIRLAAQPALVGQLLLGCRSACWADILTLRCASNLCLMMGQCWRTTLDPLAKGLLLPDAIALQQADRLLSLGHVELVGRQWSAE